MLDDLIEAVERATAEYHSAADCDAPSKANLETLSARIKSARKALSDHIANGANPCQCGATPIGYRKTAAYMHRGQPFAAVYSILCVDCTVDARGNTPGEAVRRWNTGKLTPRSHQ